MDSLTPVLIIAALILLNGFFVAAEFAIVGVPRATIEHQAARGNRVAQLIRQMLHDPRRQDHYIATAQIGITVASLGLGMYGEHVLAEWFAGLLSTLGAARWIAAHALASFLAVALLTYFHIVVGEMVPKSIALQYAERAALWITPPMLWIKTALYPVVVLLNSIGNGILRLMGIRRQLSAGRFHTSEELQYIVQESAEGGMLRPEAGRVLRDLFEFGERTAEEVMTPRVHIVGIPAEATLPEIEALIREECHTRYPVYQENLDQIIGVVHIKELFRMLLEGKPNLQEALRSVPYLPETAEPDAILRSMRLTRTQIAIIMDEHGGTAGLVTIEDLFEEVVGDIEEGITELPDIYRDDAGRFHVAGTVRLDELGEELGITLEHEEVTTVSGLVLTMLDRAPAVGDLVTYPPLHFEVTAVDGHGVGECIVTLEAQPEEAE